MPLVISLYQIYLSLCSRSAFNSANSKISAHHREGGRQRDLVQQCRVEREREREGEYMLSKPITARAHRLCSVSVHSGILSSLCVVCSIRTEMNPRFLPVFGEAGAPSP